VEKRINGLENKIAMVTSAAGGIARAFAEADVRDEGGGGRPPSLLGKAQTKTSRYWDVALVGASVRSSVKSMFGKGHIELA
jgi:hypothetical protein